MTRNGTTARTPTQAGVTQGGNRLGGTDEERESITVVPSNSVSAAYVERQIAQYVGTGDEDAWSRLRHDLLDLSVPRSDAVRIAKSYLRNAKPIIRYAAAEVLFIVGDRSGAKTLIEMAGNSDRVFSPEVDVDLREWAARTLAFYKEESAKDVVAHLYESTNNADIRRYAAQLGAKQVIPRLVEEMRKGIWKNQIEDCALLKAMEGESLISQIFNAESSALDLKTTAARAMVSFGYREPYVDFLYGVGRQYVTADPIRMDLKTRLAGDAAIRAIGGIHGDASRQLFELALDSKNVEVVQIALINLCVGYAEVEKAKTLLTKGLGGQTSLDASVLYRLAAMSRDSNIRAYAMRRDPLLWQTFAIHQKDWEKEAWLRSVGAQSF